MRFIGTENSNFWTLNTNLDKSNANTNSTDNQNVVMKKLFKLFEASLKQKKIKMLISIMDKCLDTINNVGVMSSEIRNKIRKKKKQTGI